MVRTLVLALLAAALVPAPARAGSVAAGRFASATDTLWVAGNDGVLWRMDVGVVSSESAAPGGYHRLSVRYAHCPAGRCAYRLWYGRWLPPDALRVAPDLGSARLTTTFAGRPLVAEWTATGPDPLEPTDLLATGLVTDRGSMYGPAVARDGRLANGRIRFGPLACATGDGEFGREYRVATERPLPLPIPYLVMSHPDAPEPDSPPGGLLGRRARCAERP